MEDTKIWYTAEDVQVLLANTPQVTFELTDTCNLRCEYCGYGKFYGNHDRRENNMLKFDYVRRFLNYLYGLWQSPFNKSACNRLTKFTVFILAHHIFTFFKEVQPLRFI